MPHRDPQQAVLFDDASSGNGRATDAAAHVPGEKRPGYKHVKHVGWIPDSWRVVRLEDLIRNLDAGTSVNGEDRARLNGEKAVLKVSAASYGTFLPSEHKVISIGDLDRVDTTPKAGHIIISRANTYDLVGAAVYVEEDHPDLFLPDKLWQVELRKEEDASARWLNYALSTARMRAQIAGSATGSSGSMKNISQKRFLSLPIATPPPAEQRQIARLLATWDRALAQLARLIDAKQRRLAGLMQRLLTGHVRFQEFVQSSKTQKTEVGDVPEDWSVRRLSAVCSDFKSGGTPARDNESYWQGDIPWITGADVVNQKLNHVRRYITPEAISASSTAVIRKGALLVVTRTGVGKLAIAPFDVAVSQDITGLCVREDKSNVRYLFYYLNQHSRRLKALSQGTSIKGIKRRDLVQRKVVLPPLAEQRKIVSALSAAEAEIDGLRRQRRALRVQKKGLMQKLLTGAVRVPLVEEAEAP